MKKYISTLLLVIGMIAIAQDKAASLNTNLITGQPQSMLDWVFTSADTVSTVNTPFDIQLLIGGDYPRQYDFKIKLDSISSPVASVILQGKLWSDDTYVGIDTVSWAGTSSDTTIKFIGHTDVYYRYFNTKVVVSSGKLQITDKKDKIWY